MRNLTTVILILVAFLVNAQDYKLFVDEPLLWSNWETEIPRNEKLKRIELIDDVLIDNLNKSLYSKPEENLQNFRFVDFDSDGNHDIIYYGFAGAESEMTLFFQNRKGRYHRCFEFFGKIIEMWKPLPASPLFFKFVEFPCCDTHTYHVFSCSPIMNGIGINFNISSKMAFIRKTDFPDELYSSTRLFKVQNERYVLRKDPRIENGSNGTESNVLAAYTTGDMGYVMAEATDETGRVWWFVMMLNNYQPTENKFQQSNNNSLKANYIGWMSSRYLEEL